MKQHFMLTLLAALVLSLSACGGKHQPSEPENPYRSRAENHLLNGLASMQRERWQAAEHNFSLALDSSQLADDITMTMQSWYNLAVVRTRLQHYKAAKQAYQQLIQLSTLHHNRTMLLRAQLAFALLQNQHRDTLADTKEPRAQIHLDSHVAWPADIQLLAARLAQRQHHNSEAKQNYQALLQQHGTQPPLLRMQAEADMGLALLARSEGQVAPAMSHANHAIQIARRIGYPRLIAHALLLSAELPSSLALPQRRDRLQRAMQIYIALKDRDGEAKSRTALQKLRSE